MAADKTPDEGVLDDVFATDRDRGADSAAPEPAPKPEPAPEAKSPEKPDDKAPQAPDDGKRPDPLRQYRDPATGRLVPMTELMTEREKRQEAQKTRDEALARFEALEKQFQDSQRRMAEFERRLQPPKPQAPAPDWLLEPEKAAAQQAAEFRAELNRNIFETRVTLSQEAMRAQKPDYDDVEKVFAQVAAHDPQLAQQLVNAPNPARFAYETGKRIMALQKIGADPDSYEKRIREEERQKVIEELKKGNGGQQQRFPGTLADATAAGGQGAVLTDEAMMADVFSSGRKRR